MIRRAPDTASSWRGFNTASGLGRRRLRFQEEKDGGHRQEAAKHGALSDKSLIISPRLQERLKTTLSATVRTKILTDGGDRKPEQTFCTKLPDSQSDTAGPSRSRLHL